MMRLPLRVCMCLCVGSILLGGATVDADIRPPTKGPTIQVIADGAVSRAQLRIPRNLLPEAVKVGDDSKRTQTIISGVALSAGIAFCGLVLLRRRRLGGGWTAGLIVVASLLSGGGYLAANAPPPAPVPVHARVPIVTSRPVDIVMVDNGSDIELLVPHAVPR